MSGQGAPLLAGIEAGGTKFVLAVGHSPGDIAAMHTVPTTSPQQTLAACADWFDGQGALGAVVKLGIASFGPVDLDRASGEWGHITNTPKPGWRGCDIAGYFAKRMGVPIGFDTDVNGAALAEYHAGEHRGGSSLAYVTVGTGIGGGLVINGAPVHGLAHPEMGHLYPRRHSADQHFGGICQHHGDCLEGLACGPAIKRRWGSSLSELPQDHEAHQVIAFYLAQLCHTLFASLSVETVVLGGGVMKTPGLLDNIRKKAAALDAGYLPKSGGHAIESPALGDRAGITGALLLAEAAS